MIIDSLNREITIKHESKVTMYNIFKNNFFSKYWWETTVVILSVLGVTLGVNGFCESGETASNSLYETFRMFLLNSQFTETNFSLEIARWSIFIVFLLITFRLFITIVAPQFIQQAKIRFYKNHIVICGLNKITIGLIDKYTDRHIVVITMENNSYVESLKQRKIKRIIGDPADETVLKKANISKASQLYAVTESDQKNVEIAQSAFSLLGKNIRKITAKPIKCFTLIKDCELKNVLEETALFKYTVTEDKTFFFDGVLFNINEMGIKYSICTNIEKIIPAKIETAPEILVVGLTDKAENVILDLAHCTTMKREMFRFTVVEEDADAIALFKQKYSYLQPFIKIEYHTDLYKLCEDKKCSSIFVCLENQMEAIKKAVEIRCLIADNQPDIIVFCEELEIISQVLNGKGKKILPLECRNIYLINPFEEIARYIFDLDKDIEGMAKKAHDFWNVKYGQDTEYENTSEHFKQSNRNQVLDNYLRTYIALGEKFDFQREGVLIRFSDRDAETLAIMEHRRWMIEKYANGWRYGTERKNEFKIHPCLQPWEKLPDDEKGKDYDIIEFMTTLLNKASV
jgi:hypothetical protein